MKILGSSRVSLISLVINYEVLEDPDVRGDESGEEGEEERELRPGGPGRDSLQSASQARRYIKERAK